MDYRDSPHPPRAPWREKWNEIIFGHHTCQACGLRYHDNDAGYCKHCGTPLGPRKASDPS